MPSAEILTIGTEILLGEIVDTNAPYLARCLKDLGIDLYRKTTVGDNVQRIASAILEALDRSDILIMTGGLGPTIDDPTREAAAHAFNVPVEFHPELWTQIKSRFARFGRIPTENNRRQAYLPGGATALENQVGTAPAFYITQREKIVIALPGVPREMEYLMENTVLPLLQQKFTLDSTIKTRVIHTAGAGESQIDERIGDLETLANPTVGLAAHSGQVDIRIVAKAGSEDAADQMIAPLEKEISRRLGAWVFGYDDSTLEKVALAHLADLGWNLAVVVDQNVVELLQRLNSVPGVFTGGLLLPSLRDSEALASNVTTYREHNRADVGLGVALFPREEKQDIDIVLVTPLGADHQQRPYGGPPLLAPRWAINHSLNLLRGLPISR